MQVNNRPLYIIAQDIKSNWHNINYAAKPYLEALYSLNTINDKYGYDDARSVILYFLCNAKSWRGDNAKRIKSELKSLAGIK